MLNKIPIDSVYLALGPTDLRKSIDGLSLLVQQSFHLDPFSKNLFVFCNRKKDKMKILQWDETGFWLYYKRLEKGTFQWPEKKDAKSILIENRQFQWLLEGLSIEQKSAHRRVKERTII